jgi:hypothetical protein
MKINGVTIAGQAGSSGTSGSSGSSGSSGTSGVDGGSSSLFEYSAKTTSQSGSPGSGFVLWNNSTQTGSTSISVDHINSAGDDIDIILGLVAINSKIVFQDFSNSDNYQTWTVTGTPINTPNDYYTYPVSLFASAGTGSAGFTNNQLLIFYLQAPGGTSGTSGINAFPVVTYTATTVVLGTGDASEYLRMNNANPITVSIPPQSAVTWAADTEIVIEQMAAGKVTISGGTGVTLNYNSTSPSTADQWAVIGLKRVAENAWTLFGDLTQ